MRRSPVALLILFPLVALADNPFGSGPLREPELKSFAPAEAKPEGMEPTQAGPPKDRVKAFEADPAASTAKPTPPAASMSLKPAKEPEVQGFTAPDPGARVEPSKAAPAEVKTRGRVDAYEDPTQAPDRPFRWRFALLGVIIVALAVPTLRLAFRRFTHQLELEGAAGSVPADIASQRRGREQPAEKPVAPSEKAMGIVRRAGGWVSVGRVAVQCGLDVTEAAEVLDGLAAEGRLESGTDAEGRTLFRYPQREA